MIVVGLMSGTSLDGISAAVVRFARGEGQRISAELLAWDVLTYDEAQRERLSLALVAATPAEYCMLGFDLGALFALAANDVIAQAGVARTDVAAIASHGQTIWHVPGHSTWQLGEAAVIAELTGRPVISDFRVRDVAAGGQGAPLVPIADTYLFAADQQWRALQNIGGIGNVTVVPPRDGSLGARAREPGLGAPVVGESATAGVRAFDTGPGVVVIDGVTHFLVPDLRYDVDGMIARSGTAIDDVVARAIGDPYFETPPPKSTGRELFTPAYIARFVDWCHEARPNATIGDIVATAVAFTAHSIADAYRRFLPEPANEIVLSGGGAKNPALVAAIVAALAPRAVLRFDELFFDGEAKEAVAFALLGYLHLMGEPGNVPGATGAAGPRVLGKLTPG